MNEKYEGMKREPKLISAGKARINQTKTRLRLMENGGSIEDWSKLLDAQVKSFVYNFPSEINTSPRWGMVSERRFLVTPGKAWENMKPKNVREL